MMWRGTSQIGNDLCIGFAMAPIEVLTIAFGQLAFGAASLCANGKCAIWTILDWSFVSTMMNASTLHRLLSIA